MYLVDTNLIAEILLRQARAEEVKRFLESAAPKDLYLTEFSLYSLGIILLRRNMYDTFLQVADDLLLTGRIRLVRLGLEDMQDLGCLSSTSNPRRRWAKFRRACYWTSDMLTESRQCWPCLKNTCQMAHELDSSGRANGARIQRVTVGSMEF